MIKMKWLFTLACTTAMVAQAPAFAQNTSSPLFTTPAERSSTTVPVLTDNSSGNANGIIEDVGGGRNKPAAAPAQDEGTQAQAVATQTQSNGLDTTDIGAWTKECLAAITVGPKCQITQRVPAPDGKQIVLVFSMAKLQDDDQYQIQIAVPLGISLPSGIELQIGTNYRSTLPVARCTAQGCIAEGIAADTLIAAMANEKVANALVRDTSGNPIAIEFALDGFDQATTSLN